MTTWPVSESRRERTSIGCSRCGISARPSRCRSPLSGLDLDELRAEDLVARFGEAHRLVDEGGRFHLRPFVYGMVFSRTVYAARVSLSIALVGVAFSFVLGCMPGGISGYFGSKTDVVIQRTIEIFMSLPHIPLWIALAAALPREWPVIKTYFAITVILSLISLREEEFVLAARISGMRSGAIIVRHLLPSFMSYLVVNLTLAVPSMILGETALSFMGLGIRPPAVSWGALLKAAQQVNVVALYPWLLIPGLLVIVTVLAFKFLGDGLRAAADPYR